MKKFQFRLQQVMDVREKMMKKNQRDLSTAEKQKSEAEEQLKNIQNTFERYCQDMTRWTSSSIMQLKLNHGYLDQLLHESNEKEKSVDQIQELINEIRDRLLQQQRKHKILSNLKDKHYQEFLKNTKKEEQLFLDEIALHTNTINLNS